MASNFSLGPGPSPDDVSEHVTWRVGRCWIRTIPLSATCGALERRPSIAWEMAEFFEEERSPKRAIENFIEFLVEILLKSWEIWGQIEGNHRVFLIRSSPKWTVHGDSGKGNSPLSVPVASESWPWVKCDIPPRWDWQKIKLRQQHVYRSCQNTSM